MMWKYFDDAACINWLSFLFVNIHYSFLWHYAFSWCYYWLVWSADLLYSAFCICGAKFHHFVSWSTMLSRNHIGSLADIFTNFQPPISTIMQVFPDAWIARIQNKISYHLASVHFKYSILFVVTNYFYSKLEVGEISSWYKNFTTYTLESELKYTDCAPDEHVTCTSHTKN